MPANQEPNALREQLTRWTSAGLIDGEQAARIAATEAGAPPARSNAGSGRKRLPIVVEALGYLGAALALAASFITIYQYSIPIPRFAHLASAAVAAVGLITVGAVLRTDTEPGFARLRGVLWLFGTASFAIFAAVFADAVLHVPDRDQPVLAAAAAVVCAIPLWWRNRSALQHIALFASLATLAGTGIVRIVTNVQIWQVGLAIWILSALWGTAVFLGYLVPRTTGLAVACTGLLVGASLTTDQGAGVVLAVATALALLEAGVALRRVLPLAFGAVGAISAVLIAVERYLPGSIAAPLLAAVGGVVLVSIALWLARTSGGREVPPPAR